VLFVVVGIVLAVLAPTQAQAADSHGFREATQAERGREWVGLRGITDLTVTMASVEVYMGACSSGIRSTGTTRLSTGTARPVLVLLPELRGLLPQRDKLPGALGARASFVKSPEARETGHEPAGSGLGSSRAHCASSQPERN